MPPWANDDEPVGVLFRGGYGHDQLRFVPYGQILLLGAVLVGYAVAGAWAGLLVMVVVFGPLAGTMIYFGLRARQWQWSSVEVYGDDVLVRNQGACHLFRLDTLTHSKTGMGGLSPYRLKISDPEGRDVLCFGLADRGFFDVDGPDVDDFRRAVELRQNGGS